MLSYWDPLHTFGYGCGSAACSLCAPRIEEDLDREHDKRVALTIFKGQIRPEEEEDEKPVKRPYHRVRDEQRAARAAMRIKRVLTPTQRAEALALLATWFVRPRYLRDEVRSDQDIKEGRKGWTAKVWLELENPKVIVANREGELTLPERIENAVNRVHDTMRREWDERKKLWPLPTWERNDTDVDRFEALDRCD